MDRAIYLKPSEGALAAFPDALPPLILQETFSRSDAPIRAGIGALSRDDRGRLRVDPTRPTVYLAEGSALLGANEYRQLYHIWWRARERATEGVGPSWYGFRTTLGDDGFPIVWETISNTEAVTQIYVMQSLADAADAAWDAPLPGRRFTIESDAARFGNVVVPRILSDGPVPMGPWVYLRAQDLHAATLACRCMPSQLTSADSIVATERYDLKRLSELATLNDGVPPDALRVPTGPGELDFAIPEMADANWLERALRWPPDA